MSLLIVNMTTCITPFDQWDTFNDVTHQNIPRNRTGVVADILCVAGSMGQRVILYLWLCDTQPVLYSPGEINVN